MTVAADDMRCLNQRSNGLPRAPLPHLLVSLFDAQLLNDGTVETAECLS